MELNLVCLGMENCYIESVGRAGSRKKKTIHAILRKGR